MTFLLWTFTVVSLSSVSETPVFEQYIEIFKSSNSFSCSIVHPSRFNGKCSSPRPLWRTLEAISTCTVSTLSRHSNHSRRPIWYDSREFNNFFFTELLRAAVWTIFPCNSGIELDACIWKYQLSTSYCAAHIVSSYAPHLSWWLKNTDSFWSKTILYFAS